MHNYKITILVKNHNAMSDGGVVTVEEPYVTYCDRESFNSAVAFANQVALAIVNNGDYMDAEIVAVRREKC